MAVNQRENRRAVRLASLSVRNSRPWRCFCGVCYGKADLENLGTQCEVGFKTSPLDQLVCEIDHTEFADKKIRGFPAPPQGNKLH